MLSKNQLKLISSLRSKKYRDKHESFIVEGEKSINEFLSSTYRLQGLYTTKQIFKVEGIEISETELQKISQLKSPNIGLAIFEKPLLQEIKTESLVVALDSVRDPGNMGTIIRLCDWFGVRDLVCSKDTVDCYNPKVVQASMGSLTRVNVRYLELEGFFNERDVTVYGTTMEGNSIYETPIKKNSVLLFGNEANGISEKIMKQVTNLVTIPRYSNNSTVESLNVATAVAICLGETRRKTI